MTSVYDLKWFVEPSSPMQEGIIWFHNELLVLVLWGYGFVFVGGILVVAAPIYNFFMGRMVSHTWSVHGLIIEGVSALIPEVGVLTKVHLKGINVYVLGFRLIITFILNFIRITILQFLIILVLFSALITYNGWLHEFGVLEVCCLGTMYLWGLSISLWFSNNLEYLDYGRLVFTFCSYVVVGGVSLLLLLGGTMVLGVLLEVCVVSFISWFGVNLWLLMEFSACTFYFYYLIGVMGGLKSIYWLHPDFLSSLRGDDPELVTMWRFVVIILRDIFCCLIDLSSIIGRRLGLVLVLWVGLVVLLWGEVRLGIRGSIGGVRGLVSGGVSGSGGSNSGGNGGGNSSGGSGGSGENKSMTIPYQIGKGEVLWFDHLVGIHLGGDQLEVEVIEGISFVDTDPVIFITCRELLLAFFAFVMRDGERLACGGIRYGTGKLALYSKTQVQIIESVLEAYRCLHGVDILSNVSDFVLRYARQRSKVIEYINRYYAKEDVRKACARIFGHSPGFYGGGSMVRYTPNPFAPSRLPYTLSLTVKPFVDSNCGVGWLGWDSEMEKYCELSGEMLVAKCVAEKGYLLSELNDLVCRRALLLGGNVWVGDRYINVVETGRWDLVYCNDASWLKPRPVSFEEIWVYKDGALLNTKVTSIDDLIYERDLLELGLVDFILYLEEGYIMNFQYDLGDFLGVRDREALEAMSEEEWKVREVKFYGVWGRVRDLRNDLRGFSEGVEVSEMMDFEDIKCYVKIGGGEEVEIPTRFPTYEDRLTWYLK